MTGNLWDTLVINRRLLRLLRRLDPTKSGLIHFREGRILVTSNRFGILCRSDSRIASFKCWIGQRFVFFIALNLPSAGGDVLFYGLATYLGHWRLGTLTKSIPFFRPMRKSDLVFTRMPLRECYYLQSGLIRNWLSWPIKSNDRLGSRCASLCVGESTVVLSISARWGQGKVSFVASSQRLLWLKSLFLLR